MSAFSDKLRQIFVNIHNRFVEVDNKIEDIKNSSASGLSAELKTKYDTATLQAMYNEVIEPSPEEWFTFDFETQTITGLNEEYEEEYSSADVTKLVFPYMIGGKSVKKIGEFAFLFEIDGSWLTSIPSMVNDIRLPNCIDSIGSSAFSNAPIKSINIPTSCYMIGSYAFEFCQSLEEVITPIKPNWELVIGGHAFFQCFSLINIDTIIDGVKEISEGAFAYTNVENVIIPESVDVINRNAFDYSSLRYITILNKNCNINNSLINSSVYLKLIKGYKGSTAETYAKNNGIPFMSIEGTEVFDKADKSDTYTKTEIDDKIANSGGSIAVDQTYDPESANAQSGTAVAEAFIAHEEAVGSYTDSMKALASDPLDEYYLDFEDTSAMGMLHSAFINVHNHLVYVNNHKVDKTTIIYITEPIFSFEFATLDNVEIRGEVLTSLSFTFGDDEYGDGYTSGISFDSGETPTAIDYTDSGILNWVGTDCAMDSYINDEGITVPISKFQPSPNTHYDIVLYFNGTQFIGLVNGFVPTTQLPTEQIEGNVVSE